MSTLTIQSVYVALALSKSTEARRVAVLAVANAVKRDSNPYVPFDSGTLRNSARVEMSGATTATLTYGGNGVRYARPQYYRTNYKHTTPGTRAKWFDAADAKCSAKWQREVAQAVREFMNG